MPWTIDDRFRTADNKAVVDFILQHSDLSAHDDVAEALTNSARGLSDAQSYCPDVHRYAYVVLHTKRNRIFAIACGQRVLAYRLSRNNITEALADGGSVWSDIDDDWVRFDAWTPAGSMAPKWCKIAHDSAVA